MLNHESLPIYQRALEFSKWCDTVLERTPKNSASYAQLDLARTGIVLKIASAAARSESTERVRQMELAQESAVQVAACLDLLFQKRIVSREELQHGKESVRQLLVELPTLNGVTAVPVAA